VSALMGGDPAARHMVIQSAKDIWASLFPPKK
jgi:hypothetical protein